MKLYLPAYSAFKFTPNDRVSFNYS